MKKTSSIIAAAIIVLLGACTGSGGFKKTKSGLLYKIVSEGSGNTAKKGEFLKVHYTQKIGDSVVSTSRQSLPLYAVVDSVGAIYNPVEIFPLLRKGDSVVCVMLADSLYKNPTQRPPYIKKSDKLTLTFRVVDVLPNEEALKADQTKVFEAQKKKEIDEIKEYLAKNNIQAQQTEKGTFVEVQTKGEGAAADSGKAVHVKYTGKTFGGVVFDSNIDSSFHHTEPYVLVIGQRGAIEGWDDGLRLFNKGGKGRLYVPSMLAYGPNPPQGAPFKAFENLMFEVEIVDVTDAPRQPVFPGGR